MTRARPAARAVLAAVLAPVLAGVLAGVPAGQPSAQAQQSESAAPEGPDTERLGTALEGLGKDNPLLARVNGREIRWADIERLARDLPEKYRSQMEMIFPALLQRQIDMQLIVWGAREAGLDEDAEVRRLIEEFEERVLGETLIRRRIADKVTGEMLQARYDAYAEGLAANAEVRARHILLDSEARAREVIAALDAGGDFAELAREHSLGPTAEQGGDLDYFTQDNMTPAFAQAAFTQGVGEYSRDPVQTEFGWHVIKVEDYRAEQPAAFSEMRERLREAISREMMDELLRDLRGRAEIELYPEARRVE